MKNLKKDYTFWELVGYSKKIYYVLKISQILEKEKIRKDEVKINRSKNHKFSELSTKELTNISEKDTHTPKNQVKDKKRHFPKEQTPLLSKSMIKWLGTLQ